MQLLWLRQSVPLLQLLALQRLAAVHVLSFHIPTAAESLSGWFFASCDTVVLSFHSLTPEVVACIRQQPALAESLVSAHCMA